MRTCGGRRIWREGERQSGSKKPACAGGKWLPRSREGLAQRSIMNIGKRTTEHTDHTEKKPINHFVSVYSVYSVVGHSLAESLRGKRTTEHTEAERVAQRSIMNIGKRTTEHTDHTEKKPI